VTEGKAGLRLRVLAGLVVFMFATLTTRLWFLQVLAAEANKQQAANNATQLVPVPAPRGDILDADGDVLVGNRQSLQLTVNRQAAGDQLEEVLFRLSKLLGVSAESIGKLLDDPRYYSYSPIPVAIDVPQRIVYYIEEHQDQFRGVGLLKAPVRTYPDGTLAAHVLGYLGQVSAEQLKDPAFADYRPGDIVGKTGVEAFYEHDLRGTRGYTNYRVNSLGENLGILGTVAPVPGDDVQLTINDSVQRLAEDSLKAGIVHARQVLDTSSGSNLRANAGAVIVMNPKTGGIEAMTSYPTYSPAAFTRGITTNAFDRRFGAHNGYPLLNRAIQGQYPPGSTYKPWIALSALSRGLVTPSQSYPCPSTYQVPEDPTHHIFNNWTTANLGFMSIARALTVSCDTIFYPIGYDYWRTYYPPPNADGIAGNDDQPPKEPLQHDLQASGFGHVSNLDLPAEYPGRVPDAAWKASIHQRYPKAFPFGDWVPGDFVNMSIGQGDTLVTPLQMAQAYAALENNGRMCTPHVLARVLTPDGAVVRRSPARCGKKLPFSQADLTYVRNALAQVPISGTASLAFRGFPFSQVWVAGKTGTAQVFNKQDFSWFAAMTSANGEEHVIVCLVEQGGHGSTTAAPIVRHVIEGLYGLPSTEYGTVAGTD
jgi:penicillin-binding protein 2